MPLEVECCDEKWRADMAVARPAKSGEVFRVECFSCPVFVSECAKLGSCGVVPLAGFYGSRTRVTALALHGAILMVGTKKKNEK